MQRKDIKGHDQEGKKCSPETFILVTTKVDPGTTL